MVPDALVDGRDWLADRAREGRLGWNRRRGLLGGRQPLSGTSDRDRNRRRGDGGGLGTTGGGHHPGDWYWQARDWRGRGGLDLLLMLGGGRVTVLPGRLYKGRHTGRVGGGRVLTGWDERRR